MECSDWSPPSTTAVPLIPLATDETDFHSRLGLDCRDRRDAGLNETHKLDPPIGTLDVLLEGSTSGRKCGRNKAKSGQQRRQETIVNRRGIGMCGDEAHGSLPMKGQEHSRQSLNRLRPRELCRWHEDSTSPGVSVLPKSGRTAVKSKCKEPYWPQHR